MKYYRISDRQISDIDSMRPDEIKMMLKSLPDETPAVPFERKEVRDFAEQMEVNLRRHDGRRGWKIGCDPYWLLQRAREELDELEAAMKNPNGRVTNVAHEAADVANFCMMIADVVKIEWERKNVPSEL